MTNSAMFESGALSGIRVLDAGQVIAGPMIGQLLGDFGAEVLKIEDPERGDSYRQFGPTKDKVPLAWSGLARNKKSVTLNLRSQKGIDIFFNLAEQADVVIQSFRPRTVERYGLTYETLAARNPALVVVLVSGFGQTGPYRDRPGFGTLIEAMSGYAHITGEADGPPTLPQFALADGVAAIYGAFGVMNALYWRDAQGGKVGQLLDLSLIEPLVSVLGPMATLYDQLGLQMERNGSRVWANAPRNVYQAADGRWIALAASVQQIAARCFAAIGQPELIDDPRFATAQDRVRNVDLVDDIVGGWIAERASDEVLRIMLAHDVAAAPVMDIASLMDDPQIQVRGTFRHVQDPDLGPIAMPDVVPRLSKTPGNVVSTGPRLGEHTDEVLTDLLGLDAVQLTALRGERVI